VHPTLSARSAPGTHAPRRPLPHPFDELQEIALKLYCEGMRRVLTDWQEEKT